MSTQAVNGVRGKGPRPGEPLPDLVGGIPIE